MAGYWFGKKRPGTNWRKTPVKIGDQWYTPKGEKVRDPAAYWATINRRGRFWTNDTGWDKKKAGNDKALVPASSRNGNLSRSTESRAQVTSSTSGKTILYRERTLYWEKTAHRETLLCRERVVVEHTPSTGRKRR